MSVETKPIIKAYFQTGDVPTESQFANLIDTCSPQEFNVRDYGATGAGLANADVAFQAAITAASDGDTVRIPQAEYTLTNTVVVDKTLKVIGTPYSNITIGFVDTPGFLFTKPSSALDTVRIEGNISNFTNDPASEDISVKIVADDCDVERCIISNSVYGILTTGADTGIRRNQFYNGNIYAGSRTSGDENYSAAVVIDGGDYSKIERNYIQGHGQGVLVGSTTIAPVITKNTISNTGDNGVYVSSADDAIVSFNTIIGCDGTSAKARGNRNSIVDNKIINYTAEDGTGGLGISAYNTGAMEHGIACYGSVIARNTVDSNRYTLGTEGAVRVDRLSTGGSNYLFIDDFIVEDNKFYGNATLVVYLPSVECTSGKIKNNTSKANCTTGLFVAGDAAGNIKGLIIEGNDFTGATSENMKLQNVSNSLVINNILVDAGTVNNGTSLALNAVTDTHFGDNQLGERDTTTKIVAAITETGACANNQFIDNKILGDNARAANIVSGPVVVRDVVKYDGGTTQSFLQGEVGTYIANFTTENKQLNPGFAFANGTGIRVINTGANFYFDANGSNITQLTNTVVDYVYYGGVWRAVA